jgi:hypothetical protein
MRLSITKQVKFWLLVCTAVLCESCANSIQITTDHTNVVRDVGLLGGGTAYVSVDFSRMDGVNSKDATEIGDALSTSIAGALGSSFKQTRTARDLSRIEPDSADLVLFLSARNPRYPGPWSEISRRGARFLLIGILAEAYNIFALDFPARRNDVILSCSALVLSLYELFYATRYESTRGSYSLDYQLSILKPDGTVINERQFTDSAKVMVQADARPVDVQFKDIIKATKDNVSGSVQNLIAADSARIGGIAEEMKRSYPADCDRILTFKRNIYRILDGPQISSGPVKN